MPADAGMRFQYFGHQAISRKRFKYRSFNRARPTIFTRLDLIARLTTDVLATIPGIGVSFTLFQAVDVLSFTAADHGCTGSG